MSLLEDALTDLKLYRDIFDDFEAFYQYYDRIQKEPHLLDNFVRALNSFNSPIPRRKKIL